MSRLRRQLCLIALSLTLLASLMKDFLLCKGILSKQLFYLTENKMQASSQELLSTVVKAQVLKELTPDSMIKDFKQ